MAETKIPADLVLEIGITVVSGSPITNNLAASAAGILVSDNSTTPNRIYRALSTTPGAWVLASPSEISELSDGAALLLAIESILSRLDALEGGT